MSPIKSLEKNRQSQT